MNSFKSDVNSFKDVKSAMNSFKSDVNSFEQFQEGCEEYNVNSLKSAIITKQFQSVIINSAKVM